MDRHNDYISVQNQDKQLPQIPYESMAPPYRDNQIQLLQNLDQQQQSQSQFQPPQFDQVPTKESDFHSPNINDFQNIQSGRSIEEYERL